MLGGSGGLEQQLGLEILVVREMQVDHGLLAFINHDMDATAISPADATASRHLTAAACT